MNELGSNRYREWMVARIFLLSFIWLGLVACQKKGVETTTPDLPNVVLLLGDDHGWDEVGYNGHPYIKTPVLDQMAARGLRMDRFYSASPVCSPTRGSIITGRHPNRYGTFTPGHSIRPEEVSIAQIMQQAGYTTAHFGKWHLGPVKASSPTNPGAMGFDHWVSHDNFFEMDPPLSVNGADPVIFKGEGSEVVVKEAMRFIANAKAANKPFFVLIWYGSPHEPYSGLKEDLDLYQDLPADFGDRQVTLTSNETGGTVERHQREVLIERFAEITAMDRSIGMLRDFLEEEGLRRNTLLWYFGDNGTPAEGVATMPFRGFKGQVYEGGIRVPSVLEWPDKVRFPLISAINGVSTDVLPTLCDIVGQPLPERPIDGVSLLGMLNNVMMERPVPIGFWNGRDRSGEELIPYIEPELQVGTTPLVKLMGGIATRNFKNFHREDIREEDFSGVRAWLDNQYKLVIHGGTGPDATKELFDVLADPEEQVDLIQKMPEFAGRMEGELRAWQQSVLESLIGSDY
ncbi:MAG: sulfatase-like hydrolase/transferase [Lunatimonas sp.]|uniref:sulfatase-like hydrolase/transferase n=1 Tax=Lunatimonas sp. TaxID=2060141 RepID=UPI00263AC8CF|nr:sulfatase-like hydrolase/transferase [Lunatimonas sp.]MCC5937179.1 sulfatase-like hydrolase/transferase [Lunatimonas sp.]